MVAARRNHFGRIITAGIDNSFRKRQKSNPNNSNNGNMLRNWHLCGRTLFKIMASRNITKILTNSRLLKNYGSWLYCTSCNKTVAYLCYTTYKSINFKYACKCGSAGGIALFEDGCECRNDQNIEKKMILKENRFCCSNDESPIFSVVARQISSYEYIVTCLECNETFKGNEKDF